MKRTELDKIQHANRVLKRHLDLVDGKIIFDETERKFIEELNN